MSTDETTFRLYISACHDKVDLVFLVDSSGSVGSSNFIKVKNFVTNSVTSGGTNTGDAFKFVGNNIFQPSSGDRINARNILVVITDGKSNNHLATIAQANHLKNNNILIIAVGIGSGVSKSELNGMASGSSYVLHVEDFNALSHIYDSIHSIACISGTCNDVIPNCKQYGPTVCEGTYKLWASRNCAYYCNLCNAPPTILAIIGK
ncbi:unnamed protein product [Mytilus coruscus]|uniref:VWFA domain-containing protein n=1 Tax=Mytilus coruscus TaxID=42192 RepID=A0A6J8B774_MYTCO|nr:unnamed protein product [Mytilus coruscus]